MISAKWKYTLKGEGRGKVANTRGLSQYEGIGLFQIYVPTPPAACIRLLASIASGFDYSLCQFDVEQAFVQSNLKRKFLFVCREDAATCMSGRVVRLKRSLSGLRQENRTWHHPTYRLHVKSWF